MKRILGSALWFYSFWYLGSMIAAFLNVTDFIGPVLGLAAGLIVGLDPRRVLWTRGATTTSSVSTKAVPAA